MCSHNGKELLMCDHCAEVDRQEKAYEQWKRDNRCPHNVAVENCSTCTPRSS